MKVMRIRNTALQFSFLLFSKTELGDSCPWITDPDLRIGTILVSSVTSDATFFKYSKFIKKAQKCRNQGFSKKNFLLMGGSLSESLVKILDPAAQNFLLNCRFSRFIIDACNFRRLNMKAEGVGADNPPPVMPRGARSFQNRSLTFFWGGGVTLGCRSYSNMTRN